MLGYLFARLLCLYNQHVVGDLGCHQHGKRVHGGNWNVPDDDRIARLPLLPLGRFGGGAASFQHGKTRGQGQPYTHGLLHQTVSARASCLRCRRRCGARLVGYFNQQRRRSHGCELCGQLARNEAGAHTWSGANDHELGSGSVAILAQNLGNQTLHGCIHAPVWRPQGFRNYCVGHVVHVMGPMGEPACVCRRALFLFR